MLRSLVLTLTVLVILVGAVGARTTDNGKPVKVITNSDIVGLTHFSADTVYNLSGFVYVEDGEVLVIEPGTVIKSNPGQAENATALIVARGGRLYAEGTAQNPIIFTSIDDDVDDPFDIPLPPSVLGRGLWGGVIVLGRATIADPAGENYIEGLPEEPQNLYGGNDDDDNSGVIKYISIRHGGSVIGADNEINGLTMGGVGRGTVVDYVEVFANVDDAWEIFGGTVQIRHMVGAFGGDDQMDFDEGWRGAAQFVFTINDTLDSDTYGEHDGAVSPEDQTPYSTPCISNVTAIGAGVSHQPINSRAIAIRDNGGVGYFNCIFTDHKGVAVNIEDLGSGHDSRERLSAGDIHFQNNFFWNMGGGLSSVGEPWVNDSIFAIVAWANTATNPMLAGLDWGPNGNLDPRPGNAGTWIDPVANYAGRTANPGLTWAGFFEPVDYVGAFDPNEELWTRGWTFLDQAGYFVDAQPGSVCDCQTDNGKDVVVKTNADVSGMTVFSRDTVYNLSGFVYVESTDTLIIEPGTVIKSNPGQAENATALIVARGGLIYSLGASDCPIIYTSIDDDVDDPFDIPLPPSVLGRGLWGGVIILGQATIADPAGENYIEGLPEEPQNLYGGVDDDDNSGVFKYSSIRHGGSVIGADNEINGLTMGGVGRQTQVDYVEVFANVDDAWEIFGGTVQIRHMIGAFGGDDQMDFDEGWRGAAQFVFTINDTLDSDTYGEHDGAVSPEDQTPYSTPCISNVTAVGVGPSGQPINSRAIAIRDNGGVGYFNCIFTDHKGVGVNIEDLGSGHDSRERLSVGDIHFQNNFFWNMGGGLSSASEPWVNDSIFAIAAWDNTAANPMLDNLDWGANGQLDPVPSAAGPAAGSWIDPVANYAGRTANAGLTWTGFFQTVDYMGAFDPNQTIEESWAYGWNFLTCGGYFGNYSGGGCCIGSRGNANGDPDDKVNISDVTYLTSYLFGIPSGPAPACLEEGNANGDPDEKVNISDVTYLTSYLFGIPAGPAPPACP